MEKEISEAEKALTPLASELNKLLRQSYRVLYQRMSLEENIAKAQLTNPGYEIVELIDFIKKKDGRTGLGRFYRLLIDLEENESVRLINNSAAAELFFSK